MEEDEENEEERSRPEIQVRSRHVTKRCEFNFYENFCS